MGGQAWSVSRTQRNAPALRCVRGTRVPRVRATGGTTPPPENCPENHVVLPRGPAMTINPKTTAAIGDHPLHPMLIPFPVACLVGAPLADLAFLGTGDSFWARAAMWLIGAGIVMALVAAAADFFSEPRIRRLNVPGTIWSAISRRSCWPWSISTCATRKARRLRSSRGAWCSP
ncbi:hypothetical protein TM233_04090 [Bradyrhizobium sp. TM233]|nr:hypothetical protein TM233_04090 [Bradyrhizobium sp. TM233]